MTMVLSFGYLKKFVMFYFFFFFQKAEIKKKPTGNFCNIIFLFLLKIGSVGPLDQQINLVSSNTL